MEVLLSQPESNNFANVLGYNWAASTARAEASRTGGSNCIFALDPVGSGSLTVAALATLSAPCGIVVESSSPSALNCNTLASVSAPQISVAGGATSFLCLSSTTPKTGATMPSPADPLAYLAAPAVPACGSTVTTPFHGSSAAVTVTGTAVFYPDAAYCGGITILPGATVTFQPGTYVLTSTNAGVPRLPGGLTLALGTNVTGAGVTFYNYGPNGAVTMVAPTLSLAGAQLSAPLSEAMRGCCSFSPAVTPARRRC